MKILTFVQNFKNIVIVIFITCLLFTIMSFRKDPVSTQFVQEYSSPSIFKNDLETQTLKGYRVVSMACYPINNTSEVVVVYQK